MLTPEIETWESRGTRVKLSLWGKHTLLRFSMTAHDLRTDVYRGKVFLFWKSGNASIPIDDIGLTNLLEVENLSTDLSL